MWAQVSTKGGVKRRTFKTRGKYNIIENQRREENGVWERKIRGKKEKKFLKFRKTLALKRGGGGGLERRRRRGTLGVWEKKRTGNFKRRELLEG